MSTLSDHGLEVLRKAGELVTAGDKSNTYLKTSSVGAYLSKIPWLSYGYDEPTSITERYRFYSEANQGGSVLATFTFTYANSSKSTPPNGSWS